MYRFNSITNLAPLFSAMPLGAWLMLVASTVVAAILHPMKAAASSSARQ